MLSVEEAKKLVSECTGQLKPVKLPLAEAAGLILAEDIFSPLDVPPFHQSAMDGYAICFDNIRDDVPLKICGEIPAGVSSTAVIDKGEAMRIFTGAPLPAGADTVVMQEKVEVNGNEIFIHDKQLKKGSNVRLRASQTVCGELALSSGAKLNPGATGFLASIGISQVKVYNSPAVGVIVTGRELVKPGNNLLHGQIYESNSFALQAALKEMFIVPKMIVTVDDDENKISSLIAEGLSKYDLLIITGGISVGDYDFVYKALEQCNVDTVFYKVRQKPGKPLYFGKKNNTLVFALPGNPAAVLTCFYEYVIPCIKKMMGIKNSSVKEILLSIANDVTKKEGLTYFMKGKLSGDEVVPLHSQESYLMNSYAQADCLIQLEEERTDYHKGDKVKVHLLNHTWK